MFLFEYSLSLAAEAWDWARLGKKSMLVLLLSANTVFAAWNKNSREGNTLFGVVGFCSTPPPPAPSVAEFIDPVRELKPALKWG